MAHPSCTPTRHEKKMGYNLVESTHFGAFCPLVVQLLLLKVGVTIRMKIDGFGVGEKMNRVVHGMG